MYVITCSHVHGIFDQYMYTLVVVSTIKSSAFFKTLLSLDLVLKLGFKT